MTERFTTLIVEEIGRVRRLTLNRPDHHNPLTPRCIRELLQAVQDAEADAGVSVIVIRSTGRSFSSGYGFIAEDTDPGDFPRTRRSRATCRPCWPWPTGGPASGTARCP